MTIPIVHMENGRLAVDTPFPVVRQLISDTVDTGHAVLHFHGGLVQEAAGRAIAARLAPEYRQAGAAPVFAVWESGALETIRNNMGTLASEQLFRVVLKRVQRIVRRKFGQDDGGRSAGTLPVLDTTAPETALDRALAANDAALMPPEPRPDPGLTPISDAEALTFEMELQADPELHMVVQAVSSGLREAQAIAADEAARSSGPVVAAAGTLMDPAAVDALLERPDPSSRGVFSALRVAKAIVKVAARVIRRFVSGRDHGFHATIVEEILRAFYLANIGGAIWEQMKGDTRDSFGPDPEVFGGTAMLSALAERISAGARPRITLVGHSTGAVYIAHLLDAAANLMPAGVRFDIVLLAPASTFALTAHAFARNRSRIGGLRMFTMSDENEQKDRLVPVLYPHSLLYFASGVVEPDADTPIIGMQRYYDASRYDAGPLCQPVTHHRTFTSSARAAYSCSSRPCSRPRTLWDRKRASACRCHAPRWRLSAVPTILKPFGCATKATSRGASRKPTLLHGACCGAIAGPSRKMRRSAPSWSCMDVRRPTRS